LGTPQQANNWKWPQLTPGETVETIATINYSSGTTGLPKGVCVSHANLIANVEQVYFMRYAGTPYLKSGNAPQERWIGFLPLYHAYGQLYTILMALRMLNPVYIMTEFNFERFLDTVSRHKITSLHVAPPVLVMLSKRPETSKYDISSVEEIRCGAAPLSRELQNDCQRKFGIPIRQGWGMTELTCASITMPSGSDDLEGTVGKLVPNSYCKLLDDSGREVGNDTPGELYIKGPNVCMGYWRNEEATRETIQDGWLKTGDVATRNRDGFFWIVDRKKVSLLIKP
jgi:long-subunit acyl-CoA synthetase (AMP-forming)